MTILRKLDFDVVVSAVSYALSDLLSRHKGMIASIKSKDIANVLGIKCSCVELTLINKAISENYVIIDRLNRMWKYNGKIVRKRVIHVFKRCHYD